MAFSVKYSNLLFCIRRAFYQSSCAYGVGRGAGKGGGSGGSIRDAGGILGEMGAAREEEYFRKLQSRQLARIKKHMSDEIARYRRLIQQHKDAIARLESRINELQSSDPEKMISTSDETKKD